MDVRSVAEKMLALAEKTTQGQWDWDAGDDGHDRPHPYCVVHHPADDATIADVNQMLDVGTANAAYIAFANPENIRLLCEAVLGQEQWVSVEDSGLPIFEGRVGDSNDFMYVGWDGEQLVPLDEAPIWWQSHVTHYRKVQPPAQPKAE